MPYSYITQAQARSQLASRLYDASSNLFWSDAEKNQYIYESLRVWNALTLFWRSEFVFETVSGTVWYDLTDASALPDTLRATTITDNNILQLVEHHLLEPLTSSYPLAWSGSAQFSVQVILDAIQRCRDEVLSITGCTITRRTVAATTGRIILPDTVMDIRRIAWLPVSGLGLVNTPMWSDDQWTLQSYENDYTVRAPGVPSTYRRSSEPPLSFDVDIPPAIPGQYEILSVDAGAALSTAASTVLPIPNDFSWVIKWGALADLLSRDSNARDPLRAQYCWMRYQQGLALLLNSSALLYARIANVPLDVDSAQNADNFRPRWQSAASARPDLLMTSGLNLIGLAATPNAVYAITAMIVQNAPIPASDGDYIQISRDDLDAVLDHAQHIASFKMGGQEFISTVPLLQRFYKRAALYNSKLMELGEFAKPTYELSQLQAQTNPVYSEANPVAD